MNRIVREVKHKMTKSKYLFVIFSFIFSFSATGFADSITTGTGNWMPYFAPAGNKPAGFFIDIANTILSEAGHTMIVFDIPYVRTYSLLYEGRIDMLLGPAKREIESIDKVVIASEEISIHIFAFFTLKGNIWKYEGVQSLSKVCLGATIGERYPGLESYFVSHQNNLNKIQLIGGTTAYERNLKKLVTGRVDVILDNKKVIKYFAHKFGFSDQIQFVGNLGEPEKLYAIFTKKNPKAKEYSLMFTEGIRRLRKSGKLKALLDVYGLEDWKK